MAIPPLVIRGMGSGLSRHILQLISCGEMRDANMFVVSCMNQDLWLLSRALIGLLTHQLLSIM